MTQEERKQPIQAPRIDSIAPAMTKAGLAFMVQPSGDSAMSVRGSNFQTHSAIRWGDTLLKTAYGGPSALTAIVPDELYSREDIVPITVRNPDGQISNAQIFKVMSAFGPAPAISKVAPSSCEAGAKFNVQPNGDSALGVEGKHFLPGAVIYFGNTPIPTAFGNTHGLSATVPPPLLERSRTVRVTVRNPDGMVSRPAEFVIGKR